MNTVYLTGMLRYDDLGFSLHRVTLTRDNTAHIHTFYELEIILSGHAVNSINGHCFPVGPGDVLVVGKGATHEITETDQLELYNLGFHMDSLRHIGNDLLKLPGFHALFLMEPLSDPASRRLHLKPTEFEKVKQILEQMYTEYQQDAPGCRTILLSDFTKLVVLLSRNYGASIPQKDTLQMASAVAKMERDYAQLLSIEALAGSAYMSERHFRRQFEKIYGQSPKAYLLQIRLNAAIQMLWKKQTTISEIALACGFSDCNHFSRVFRQKFGMSPTEYRKRYG